MQLIMRSYMVGRSGVWGAPYGAKEKVILFNINERESLNLRGSGV